MKKLIVLLWVCAALLGQTAKFPSEVVTDVQLRVAKTRAQTTLPSQITAAATNFAVADGSKIAVNSLITIGDEVIAVCGVSGNTVTVGYSSCPNVDGRGFNDTSAASHNASAAVYDYITSWHHNAMVEEIEAVETALGAELANVEKPLTFTAPIERAINAITCSTCVVTSGSYSDPNWLTISKGKVGLGNVENTALSTWVGSTNVTTLGTIAAGTVPWARLSNVPATFAPSGHNHSGADITSGTVGAAYLGSGTPNGTKFLRDDNTWQTVAGGIVYSFSNPLSESGGAVNCPTCVATGGSYSDPAWLTLTKAKVGLGSVENTALSTWAGSGNITTLGTIASGTVPWARLSNVPASFTPSAHATNHATGQSDAIAPSAIGAMASVAGSGVVKVTSGTPGLVSGNASDCVKVDGSSGACGSGNATAPLTLTGTTDAIQFDVTGNGTQTVPIMRVRKNDGTVTFQINADGSVDTGTGTGPLDLIAIAAPDTPASGTGSVYIDSTDKTLKLKNDAGTVTQTVVSGACAAGEYVRGYNANGTAICATPTATPPDPHDGSTYSDVQEFVCNQAGTCAITGWYTQKTATNNGGLAAITAVGHPGAVRVAPSSSAANDGQVLWTTPVAAFGSGGVSAWKVTWEYQMQHTADIIVRVGLAGDCSQAVPANFIGVRFDTTTGSADTYWTLETRASSVATVNTGTANLTPNATHWMRLTMVGADTGSVAFTLADLTGATSTTWTNSNSNVPTVALAPCASVQNVNSAGSKFLNLDRYAMTITGLTR